VNALPFSGYISGKSGGIYISVSTNGDSEFRILQKCLYFFKIWVWMVNLPREAFRESGRDSLAAGSEVTTASSIGPAFAPFKGKYLTGNFLWRIPLKK
jgi:hypothetical protein